MSDPKSEVEPLEPTQTKHLRDSQLRRPPWLKVRRDQRVWWPSAELLLRRIVSHDSNVNGHVADVTFDKKSIRKLSPRVQDSSESRVVVPIAYARHAHYPRASAGRRLAFLW